MYAITMVKAVFDQYGTIKSFELTHDDADALLESEHFKNVNGYGSYADGFVLTDDDNEVAYLLGERAEDNFFFDIVDLRNAIDQKGVVVK